MKRVTRFLSLLLVASLTLLYVACDDDDPSRTEEETQLDKLRGTWNIQSVDNDGTSRTDEYPNMTLTISGTYTTGGEYSYTSDADEWPSVSPWKAADSWKFKSTDVLSVITRQSDLLDMTYTLSNSDNTLTIDFTYSGTGFNNARTESVSGNWSFVFTK